MTKPHSEASEQNKGPILEVLQRVFADSRRVLEIGSGTGQHALWFSRHLPHLEWQTSDLAANHAGIRAWLDAAPDNALAPLDLDVCRATWSALTGYDALFSANTVHIMGWPAVKCLFTGAGRLLPAGGLLVLYGPFNYAGRYTSESNARFDAWLKGRDPASGIRDFEALDDLAAKAGLSLAADYPMPANNHTLVWKKG